ncbi:MAG: YeeE/YedE family protein [Gammaproteobacteria bacterium]|nr:YeeE/YedE family protein [Gammaproteobacteria bacterium]
MLQAIIALLCGLIFGVGLAMSGMTDTRVVLGFLDVAGQWNPALLLVMTGALAITIPAFSYLIKKGRPLFCDDFCLPEKTSLDLKLIGGAVLFGLGWGLYGYCPGPALASLSTLNPEPFVFVAAMAAGMLLQSKTGGSSS